MTETAVRLRRASIIYHERIEGAAEVAGRLRAALTEMGPQCRVSPSLSLDEMEACIEGADLVVTLGGDGTVLRAAHLTAPRGIPLLAVNLGRVGFLSEVGADDALPALQRIVAGEGWIEERIMLAVEHPIDGQRLALNDAVLSRGFKARVIGVRVWIDETFACEYRADGVVVASPTGSTAYNLALGGPVLDPEAQSFLITPIATYPRPTPTLVVPADSVIRLQILSDHGGGLTIDGQDAHGLNNGDEVTLRRAEHRARLWRLRPRGYFYPAVLERLK